MIIASILLYCRYVLVSILPAKESSSYRILAFEMDYLKDTWTVPKIVISSVPYFLYALTAAWKKLEMALGVIIGAAVLKFVWSCI